jgi:DNA mismatch repair protein MutS
MGTRWLRHALHHPAVRPHAPRAIAMPPSANCRRGAADAPPVAAARRSDIERITARIALRSARPRDLSALRDSLGRLAELRAALGTPQAPLLVRMLEELATPEESLRFAGPRHRPRARHRAARRRRHRRGLRRELDELRGIQTNCGAFLLELEARERERTGIANLRWSSTACMASISRSARTPTPTRCPTTTAAARR